MGLKRTQRYSVPLTEVDFLSDEFFLQPLLSLIITPPGPYYRLKDRTLAATAQKQISQSFHQQQRENNFSSFDFGVSSVRNKSESLQVDVTASFQQQPVSTQICTRERSQERLIHATCFQCPLCDFYRSLEYLSGNTDVEEDSRVSSVQRFAKTSHHSHHRIYIAHC